MIGRTNTGGGGGGLNFKIIAYATKTELLADIPKENTIGVVTTNKINAWVLSPKQPESMMDGGVWISTGSSSPVAFDALKANKSAIIVYPVFAKQYVSGSWVTLTAKSYRGGEWCDWFDGNIYENGTYRVDHFSCTSHNTVTVTDFDTYIQMFLPAGTAAEGYMAFGPFDLSRFSTLTVEGINVTSNNAYLCGFVATKENALLADAVASVNVSKNSTSVKSTVTLDLSSLRPGMYYIYAGWNTAGGKWSNIRKANLTKVKVE